MEMLIVALIVIVVLGAFATFLVAEFLPHSVLIQAEEHGRFAGLADEIARGAESSVAARRLELARGKHVGPV
ncbi:hypothetical protein [Caballeronia glathei]|uniref:Oxalate:formate antiporter n=1 Tax=Caballeronia glathei TaxID=60547 RepID=A0A069PAJ9_9BURK|nr:hypothetical protein [Caballeronia glathei]KDR37673.1 oxalate:formate antiporter [Caballeronia glathei]